MPRRKQFRKVSKEPLISIFKPAGIPAKDLDEMFISVDEFEAVRLADFEGMNQREASDVMHVSQPTFNRILTSARKKIAETIVRGIVLRIEGGEYVLPCDIRVFECEKCGNSIDAPLGQPRPRTCPQCGSNSLYRKKILKADEE
jgi:predicted DNA-binding protein (UPF0251 family)